MTSRSLSPSIAKQATSPRARAYARLAGSPVSRLVCVAVLVLSGAVGWKTTRVHGHTAVPASITGLHVSGNRILNGANQPIVLHGVNRSGTEYACIQGWGIFDGPNDAASVQAIAAWHTNAVRVPLNEDCWLAINGVNPAYSGAIYQQAIAKYVNLLNQYGLVAILEMHLNAPGTQQATGQEPMPDADHAPAFWTSVANYFKTNSSVIFDLYNEPYPDYNRDTTAAWTCWKVGGTCAGVPFQAAGMQSLVTTVRKTGARNVIMLGGVTYAGSISRWLAYKPSDPTGNLAAAWHVYNFGSCVTTSCYNSMAAPVAQKVPLIAGEIGENDCAHGFIDPLMAWLDAHNAAYLGWTWDTWNCNSGPALITDYNGDPTNFGVGLKNHLAALAGIPTPTPTTAPPTSTPAPGTPTPLPTPVPTATNSIYSFEDGTTDGWTASGAPFSGDANSAVRYYDGTHSLAITASAFTNSQYPYVWVIPPVARLLPGMTVTAQVWAPSGSNLAAQLFASDAQYTWHMEGYVTLSAGGWTTLTYTIPSGIPTPLYALGVQYLNNSGTPFSGSLYVDAIDAS